MKSILLGSVLTENRIQKQSFDLHRNEFQRLRELAQMKLRFQHIEPGEAKVVALSMAAAAPGELAESAGAGELPLILAVEADPAKALQISQWLGPEYRIVRASAGQEALKTTRETAPDLVIANVLLPGWDGLELCRGLKRERRAGHIPVILVSSYRSENYQLKALQAGADDYLAKPFNPLLLRVRVANLLRSRRQLQEWFHQQAVRQPWVLEINQADAEFLRRATEIVEKDLADFRFDVAKLSKALFISRRQLLRRLKAVAGCAPNAFIRTVRLQKAAELLKTSGMTVMEITYAVGFSDLKHFRTLFRDAFGALPAEYGRAVVEARRA